MIYHVLNGDALTGRFSETRLTGQMVVARECLVEGNLEGDTLADFYKNRAGYIQTRYGETEGNYYQKVVAELDKLVQVPEGSEINLWFGYDLFCQVNLWFIFSLLDDSHKKHSIYLVYPSYLSGDDVWDDFGNATPEILTGCYNRRLRVDLGGIALGTDLWTAYKDADFAKLEELSKTGSPYFPYLREVCQAHRDRFPAGEKGRPEKVVEQLIKKEEPSTFNTVFRKFSQLEGVYGFSDLQVKQIFDTVNERKDD